MNASKLQGAVHLAHAYHDDSGRALTKLVGEVDALVGEHVVIAQILFDFYHAELSMSSVQPVLDLAVRLNPSLAPKLSIVKKEANG